MLIAIMMACGTKPRTTFGHRMDKIYPEMGRRLISRKRRDVFLKHAAHICIALQPFDLPADQTVAIIDETVFISQLVPYHTKWNLVVLVKHFKKIK